MKRKLFAALVGILMLTELSSCFVEAPYYGPYRNYHYGYSVFGWGPAYRPHYYHGGYGWHGYHGHANYYRGGGGRHYR